MRDVACVTISRGQLAKLIAKVSESMRETYELLLGILPDESFLNVARPGIKLRQAHGDLVFPCPSLYHVQDHTFAGLRF